MWWDGQNLDKPRRDSTGKLWHFRVWSCVGAGQMGQRVFFWDHEKRECGVVLLLGRSSLHVSKLHQLIDKLAADSALRQRYQRELEFQLERHYSNFGAFPEEVA